MKGFIHFIRTQGIVGFATGFIIGGAISKTVTAFVNDVVNPIIGVVLGRFSDLTAYTIGPVLFGDFVSSCIDFLIIAAVVYVIFKGFKLDRLDEKKEG